MKKRKFPKMLEAKSVKNPVAKFAFQFNKAQVFKDKTKYKRSAKHKDKASFPIFSLDGIGKDALFFFMINDLV
jgi:hypothetical protein